MAADETTDEPVAGRRHRAKTRRPPGLGRSSAPGARAAAPLRPHPLLSAAAVGLLVALLARVLVFGGERACDAVRGTSTCGGAGGFMLVAILAVMLYAGARLLRMLAVPEPGTTSTLGLALFVVVLLAVLVDYVFSAWMWVVLPLLAAVLYASAAWAAARLAAAGDR